MTNFFSTVLAFALWGALVAFAVLLASPFIILYLGGFLFFWILGWFLILCDAITAKVFRAVRRGQARPLPVLPASVRGAEF